MSRVIYDFGANNGDDIPYYLMRADQVVAVEANPVLADQIQARFAAEIANRRLFVESCALTVDHAAARVPFFIHRTNHVESQFPEPAAERRHLFDRIEVPSKNVLDIVRQYGEPYYVKVDIEHYDQAILRALFEAEIFPAYISAESHSIEVFALLIALGGYRAFKMVEGRAVQHRYQNQVLRTSAGAEVRYSFPEHSAGPFGADVAGPWMTMDNFFRVLGVTGLGWRDIHASRVDPAEPNYVPRTRVELRSDF